MIYIVPLVMYGITGLFGVTGVAASTENALKIDQGIIVVADPSPRYPSKLWYQGVKGGHATIVVTVDESGFLDDWLVIEASHRDFIKSIEEVIYRWDFKPARIDGAPIRATQRIPMFLDGSRIKKDTSRSEWKRVYEGYAAKNRGGFLRNRNNKESLKFVRADELDKNPVAMEQPPPLISDEAAKRSKGGSASFRFYIDTSGAARLPTLYKLYGEVAPEVLLAAQAALEKWRFQPPTSDGEPVVCEVVQSFVFTGL